MNRLLTSLSPSLLFTFVLVACQVAGNDPAERGEPDASAAGTPDAGVGPEVGPTADGRTFRTDGCGAGVDGCLHSVGPDDRPAALEVPGGSSFFVEAAAAPGGDGSEAHPFSRIGDALEAAVGVDALIRVAAGRYAEHLAVTPAGRTWSIMGEGASRTILEVAPGETGLAATGAGRLRVSGVRVAGGRIGVRAADLSTLEMIDSTVEGAAVIGIALRGLPDVRLERVHIRTADDANAHVVVQDAVLRLHGVEVGPGAAPGILAGPGDVTPVACPAWLPACPFAAVVDLSQSWLHGLAERGLELQQSRFRIDASRIEGITSVDNSGVGFLGVQSFGAVAEGSVVTEVSGAAVALLSTRALLRDLRLTQAIEGLRVARAPSPWPMGDAPADWHPGWEWTPVAGVDWHPGWEWQPKDEGLPDEAALPPALRRGSALPNPALALLRWARVEGDRVTVDHAQTAGVLLMDHVTRLRDLTVRETLASDSAAVRVTQTTIRPISEADAPVVALSRIERATLTDNGGTGVRASRVALIDAFEVAGQQVVGPWPGVTPIDGGPIPGRLGLFDVEVLRGGGPGIVLIEAVADVGGAHIEDVKGIGLWSAGALARWVGNQVTGIADAPTRDLHGDGLVLATGELWRGLAEYLLEARDNSVVGAARAGLLVDDRDGTLRGRLALGSGGFAGRTTDAALVGSGAGLVVEGIEFETFTPQVLPPPISPAE